MPSSPSRPPRSRPPLGAGRARRRGDLGDRAPTGARRPTDRSSSGEPTLTPARRRRRRRGSYVVEWLVVGDDAHPARGAFVFSVGAATRASAPAASHTGIVLQALGRWVSFAGFALGFGVPFAALLSGGMTRAAVAARLRGDRAHARGRAGRAARSDGDPRAVARVRPRPRARTCCRRATATSPASGSVPRSASGLSPVPCAPRPRARSGRSPRSASRRRIVQADAGHRIAGLPTRPSRSSSAPRTSPPSPRGSVASWSRWRSPAAGSSRGRRARRPRPRLTGRHWRSASSARRPTSSTRPTAGRSASSSLSSPCARARSGGEAARRARRSHSRCSPPPACWLALAPPV